MIELLNNPFFILFIFIAVAALVFMIIRQESVPGIIFLSFAAMGVFFETSKIGKIAMFKAVFLPLILLLLIVMKFVKGQRFPRINLILITLFTVMVAFSSWLNNISFDLTRPYLATLLIAFVIALCPNNEKTTRYTLIAFAFWGGINLLATVSQWAGHGWVYKSDAIHTGFRSQGLMGTSTMMGVYFVIALNAVHVLFYQTKATAMRVLLFCFGIGLAVGLLGTLSRASLIAWGLSALYIQYRLGGMKLRSIISVIAAVLMVMSVSSLLHLNNLIADRFAVVRKDPSAQSRVPLLEMAMTNSATSPYFGIGLSQGGLGDKNVVLNSHNTFVQKIMENGIFGFSLFCIIMWKAIRGFRKRINNSDEAVYKASDIGLLAILGAILINGFFHDLSYLMPLWLIIGLGMMTQEEELRETN